MSQGSSSHPWKNGGGKSCMVMKVSHVLFQGTRLRVYPEFVVNDGKAYLIHRLVNLWILSLTIQIFHIKIVNHIFRALIWISRSLQIISFHWKFSYSALNLDTFTLRTFASRKLLLIMLSARCRPFLASMHNMDYRYISYTNMKIHKLRANEKFYFYYLRLRETVC